ncbi:MAG: glycosyltransferase family 4 protein [Saprospiraceae bacterium]|nr:glycosyltransferase family 4 protein [Saprospiraceae bacterium]
MTKPRVLFVLEYYYPHIGGVETLFHQLVNALEAEGVACTILTQRHAADLAPKEISAHGSVIHRIKVPNRYLFTLVAFWWGISLFRKTDLIHTTSYNAGIPAFLGGFLFSKPVLITFHEAWGKLWFALPFMSRISKVGHYWFEQILLRLPFKFFVGVSEATSTRLHEEGVPLKKIRTIYNGLNYNQFPQISSAPPPPSDSFKMTYFGRIGLSKGLDQLLPAFAAMTKVYPKTTLTLIVPEKPVAMKNWLENTIQTLRITNHITIRSSLPYTALIKQLKKSDCVVIPSYSEGFCFVAAEAAALHIPIVHSNQGALPEVVSGYHIAAKSHQEQHLLEALNRAAQNDWAFIPQRRFHLHKSVSMYLELYQEALPQLLPSNAPRS